ncbi:MAG: hypothetical protein HZB25_02570 [Candidatus Eisenbacteria bacterium]|nr:hypothetical protein [Candidatus Eisenbacteria bacterium]
MLRTTARGPHRGVAPARRRGLARARGPAIAALLALACLLGAAGVARAQGPARLFSMDTVLTTNNRAGETAAWRLVLRLPQGPSAGVNDTVVIHLFLPGSGNASLPGFSTTGAHVVDSVTGVRATFLSDSITGDPVNGTTIRIRYRPQATWDSTKVDTFYMHGIVSAATAGNVNATVQGLNFKTVPATVLPTTLRLTVRSTAVSTFLVRGWSGSAPAVLGTQTAGAPFDLVVDAVDRFGNAVDTATTVVLTDSTATLSQPLALTLGRGIFLGAVLTRAAPTDYIRAQDSQHTGRSGSFAVLGGPLHHFVFSAIPANQVANHPFAGRVEARDTYNNIADGFVGPASATDVSGLLAPSSLAFTAGVWAGTFTVPVAVDPDSILIFASGKLGSSNLFHVAAQHMAGFAVNVSGAPVTAGVKFPLSIRAVDDSGYTVGSYTTAVQLGDSTGTIVPSATGGFTAGIWSDSVRVTRARVGNRIAALGVGYSGLSVPFSVVAGPTLRLMVTAPPDTAQVANPSRRLARVVSRAFPLTVSAVDAYGNLTSSFAGTATLDDRKHRITPTTGAIAAGSWSGTVVVSDTTAFNQVTATSGAFHGSSAYIDVNPPSLALFSVTPAAGAYVAGVPFAVTIRALDDLGGTTPYFTSSVNMTDDSGTLAPLNSGAFTAGVVTVNCTITMAATTKIHVEDLLPPASKHTGVSAPFTVQPAPHAGFDFAPIATQKARVPFLVTMRAVDAYNNMVPTFNGVVGLTDLTGTLDRAATSPFTAGAWTGTVTVGRGTPADRLTASYNLLTPSQSGPFQVDAATPRILGVQPPFLGPGASSSVRVLGRFFEPGAQVHVQSDVTVSEVTYVSPDTLLAKFDVSPLASNGWRPVTVTQFHASVSDTTFQIATPRVRPRHLGRGAEGRSASIAGIYLMPGTNFDFGADVHGPATSPTLPLADSIAFPLSVDTTAILGEHPVTGTNPRGIPFSFPGLVVMPRPAIASVSPDSAAFGVSITVTGTGLDPGSALADSVSVGGTRGALNVGDSLTAHFILPDDAALGAQGLRVSAFGSWSPPVLFQVLAPRLGDVTGDGHVTLADVAVAADAILGRRALTPRERFASDCDTSGAVDVVDLVCMVDLAARATAPGTVVASAERGSATWDAAAHGLRLPEGARAVQWTGSGTSGGGASRESGGAHAWRAVDGSVVGVAAVGLERFLRLPSGVRGVTEVLWADGAGRVNRAALERPAPPARFQVLGNPQHGRAWFAVPLHAERGSIEIFDAAGRRVGLRALDPQEAGQVTWEPASRMPAGVYLVRFRAGAVEARSKLVLLP